MSDGFATDVIVPHTEYFAWKYARYNVVFDINHQYSLKSETWQKRRTGVHKKS